MKKIILILIFIFYSLALNAKVILHAPSTFVKGEGYIFKFEAIGSSIKFPKLKNIDGYIVEDFGTSRSLQIINGNYDEKISKNYRIDPTKDFIIPSFTFEINGEEVKSEEKQVVERKIQKTDSSYFDLTLTPSKTELYVGEDLIVKLIFKYKKGLQITNLGFEKPHFEDFWYEKIENSSKRYEENGYVVQELDFLLFPQKSGKLKVEALRVDVQMLDSNQSSGTFGFFSSAPKVVKVYSNDLSFDIKELPENINLIGEFDITVTVDKEKINQGEAVSYKLNIKGVGNLDDIQDIKLDIPNTTIYDNKPELKTQYKNNRYEGSYSKSYSIVPDQSIKIPSITFKYFSKKDKKIVIKKTKAFNIEVKNQQIKKVVLEKAEKKPLIKKEVIINKESSFEEKLLYFLFGVIFTLLIIGLYTYAKIKKSNKKKEETPLIKLVKNSKYKQDIMKVLIPFIKTNSSLDKLIYQCEGPKEFKILKKEIIDLLKQIKI
jgi:hypothetical protein